MLAKIVDHYRDMLAISGSLNVGDALTLANGPVASGSGTQYSGAMTEELLAVIREVISSPDSFRQSAYTLDPAQKIMDRLLGVTWKLGAGETQESVLSAIQSQVREQLGSDGDKVTVTLANYVSSREFDLRFRVSHGYTVLEQTDTGHRCQYQSVITAPNCTEGGYTLYRCTDCQYSYVGDETPATGHKEVTDKAVAATCTEPGLTEGKHCETCGEVLLKQEETQALGHSYQDVVTKPTCTEQGYTTHTCAICGDSYVDGDMDALGHSYGNWQKYSEPFRRGIRRKPEILRILRSLRKPEDPAPGPCVRHC